MKQSDNFYMKFGILNASFPGNHEIYEAIKVICMNFLAAPIIFRDGTTPKDRVWHLLSFFNHTTAESIDEYF